MIPYDIDPSLHASEPEPDRLGDGFSPPPDPHHGHPDELSCEPVDPPVELALGEKSPF
jgi:hypothetical protein